MADAFGVDPDRLADILQRMAHYQVVTDSMLAEIDVVANNLQHNWDGAAGDAYDTRHDQWRRGAAMMRDALVHLRQAGAHAHQAYTSAIEANQKIWA